MFAAAIVHAVLQLIIVSLYFWVYLLPQIQTYIGISLNKQIGDSARKVMDYDCNSAVILKWYMRGKERVFVDKDPVRRNTNLLLMVANIVIVLLLGLLVSSIVFARPHWIVEAGMSAVEVTIAYVVVLIIQVWFTGVVKNYKPYTNEEMTEIVKGAVNSYCIT